MLAARKFYSYGEQNDYFDDANCVGWVRKGTHDKVCLRRYPVIIFLE